MWLQWGAAATVPPVGAFSSVPGGRLLEELLALPALAGEADNYQVSKLSRNIMLGLIRCCTSE